MRYWPALSLTTVRLFSMSAGLAASTATPGSTAADGSRTTPAIVAWAYPRLGRNRTTAAAAAFTIRCMRLHLHAGGGRLSHASVTGPGAAAANFSQFVDKPGQKALNPVTYLSRGRQPCHFRAYSVLKEESHAWNVEGHADADGGYPAAFLGICTRHAYRHGQGPVRRRAARRDRRGGEPRAHRKSAHGGH